MFYQCPICDQIYHRLIDGQDCCRPEPIEIDDVCVVVCWRCKGCGCEYCGGDGIILASDVRMAWALKQKVDRLMESDLATIREIK